MKKVIIALLCMATAFTFIACKKMPSDTSSAFSSYVSIPEIKTESTEPSSEEQTTVSNESNNVTTDTTFSQQESSVDTTTSTSTGGRTFVQPADPNTGISWDGVSPIIYTYPDGTTGTEKRVGATFEAVPGIIGTVYEEIEKVEYDGHCPDCGKVQGDGSNGTCGTYLMVDTCPLCGETGIQGKCHTCGE